MSIATVLIGFGMALSLSAPGQASTVSPPAIWSSAVPQEVNGPRSPAGRQLADPRISQVDGAVARSFDLGDLSLGSVPGASAGTQFRAPVRGVLVTPRNSKRRAELLVVTHLRYPNCGRTRFAFPCPKPPGRRFDQGMRYLGVEMARRGYSVLIPDLAPLYVGDDLDAPYDQETGFTATITQMLETLRLADAGLLTRYGPGLGGRVDASRIGLIGHSRSASASRQFVKTWQRSWSRVSSVMMYGGAYQVEYHGREGTFPAMPDVPFLGVVGDEDQDTGFMGAMWLSHHIDQKRSQPALMAVVPGLGHTYINRTLSRAGIDDRICEVDCPNAKAHERFLVDTASRWFGTTLRGRRADLPIRPTAALPARLSGLSARWLAVSDGQPNNVYLAGQTGELRPFGPVGTVRTCYPLEDLAPFQPGDCRPPARAVTQNAAAITRVRVAPTSGVFLSTPPTSRVAAVALHLSPSDDRTDGRRGNPVVLAVRLDNGKRIRIPISAQSPALLDRARSDRSGVYTTSTVRVNLPRWTRAHSIVGIGLSGGPTTSRLDLRGIDLVPGKVA